MQADEGKGGETGDLLVAAELDSLGWMSGKKCSRFRFAKESSEDENPADNATLSENRQPDREVGGGTFLTRLFQSRQTVKHSRAEILAFYSASRIETHSNLMREVDPADSEILNKTFQLPEGLIKRENSPLVEGGLIPKELYDQFARPQQLLPSLNLPINPFSENVMVKDAEDKIWYYIDERQQYQGPFSGEEMDFWYSKGYFKPDLQIGVMKDAASMISLKDMIAYHQEQRENPPRHASKVLLSIEHSRLILL